MKTRNETNQMKKEIIDFAGSMLKAYTSALKAKDYDEAEEWGTRYFTVEGLMTILNIVEDFHKTDAWKAYMDIAE